MTAMPIFINPEESSIAWRALSMTTSPPPVSPESQHEPPI